MDGSIFRRCSLSVLTAVFFSLLILFSAGSAFASTFVYSLSNHPDGNQRPPQYGLRLDELFDLNSTVHDVFTFDFDNAASSMQLVYDDVAGTINISGTAFGGLDQGSDYDPSASGLWDIDFTFRTNIVAVPGNLTVTAENAANNGTITPQFAIGGNAANTPIALVDEDGGKGFSFQFDNGDHRLGGTSLAGDPNIFVGWGWLNHSGMPHVAASDWLFVGREVPEPGTVILFGSALLGASRMRRKKAVD